MVRTLTLYGWPGTRVVTDSRLAYINKVIKVQRSGIEHDPIVLFDIADQPQPPNRAYYHHNASGAIYFGEEFPFAISPPDIAHSNILRRMESVFIIYDT